MERTPTELEGVRRDADAIVASISEVIVGKKEVIENVLLGMLAGGHVLMEDLPGLAKTLMARSFAQAIGMGFKRIQFTPDLLPSDVTGSYIYDQRRAVFEFSKGPIFTNLLLGDEINRAPPKTQAALLEAMQEKRVTVEDTTHDLPHPFVVIATQNPIEHEGTYPLPEAQLDRFLLRTSVGYPSEAQEVEMLALRIERARDEAAVRRVVDRERFVQMQEALERVHVSEHISAYVVALTRATRGHPDIAVGASPRGSLAVMALARGRALLSGRDFVSPSDVKDVTVPALAHRLTLRPELWVRRVRDIDVVQAILDEVPTPRAEDAVPGPGASAT
jgi:MoxR-like ATPase